MKESAPELQPIEDVVEVEEKTYSEEIRVNIGSKRPQSSHQFIDKMKVNKMTKSAHLLGNLQRVNPVEMVSALETSVKHLTHFAAIVLGKF